MRNRGFTLLEIVVVAFLVILVSGTVYKLFSGAFENFFKSQTKLTNLRSASLLLEHLKHDIRLATVPTSAATKYSIVSSTGSTEFKFQIQETKKKMVTYLFKNGVVQRFTDDGSSNRTVSGAKVSKFQIAEKKMGATKYLEVEIEVDADLNDAKRSSSNKGNKSHLTAVMFPRFFQSFTDKEEEYWAKARQLVGGKS